MLDYNIETLQGQLQQKHCARPSLQLHAVVWPQQIMNSSVTESPFAQLLRPLNLKMHAFL